MTIRDQNMSPIACLAAPCMPVASSGCQLIFAKNTYPCCSFARQKVLQGIPYETVCKLIIQRHTCKTTPCMPSNPGHILTHSHALQHSILCAGGAIFVDSGSQSNITASDFTLNTAGQSGGAVAQADSVSVVTDSEFSSNLVGTQGGAWFQNNMTGSVTGCRFFNNTGMTGVSLTNPC